MYKNALYFVLIAYLIFTVTDAKKSNKRIKRPTSEDDSTPQPNVVTYSTFGFNDVRNFDGFVPSSPDYASYMNSHNNKDSSTRLYAPAFPTAMDNYPSAQDSQTFNVGDDNSPQASMLQYSQNPISFHNTPPMDNEAQSQNTAPEIYGRNAGEMSAPIYGTKIGSRGRTKGLSQFNNTDFNLFESASSPMENKYSPFNENPSSFEGKLPTSYAETSKNYQFNFNYATTHPSSDDTESDYKSPQSFSQTSLKFPKVVDFTKYKQNYPLELESKYSSTTTKAPNTYRPASSNQNDKYNYNSFAEIGTKYPFTQTAFKDPFKKDKGEEFPEKNTSNPLSFSNNEFSQNYVNYENKNVLKDTKPSSEFKDKFKYNSWPSTNYTNDYKTWKNPIKGYQYSTNFSNMNFEFDFSDTKAKPSNNDNEEVVPASSNNIIDATKYQYPEVDYSLFKKFPGYKGQDGDDFENIFDRLKPQGQKYDPEEYVRSLYSTAPSTTSLWDSSYKSPDFSSYKHHGRRPHFGEELGDDVVHIPKRPYSNKYSYGKFSDNKPSEWSSYSSYRPHKPKKPVSDWNKEASTRFKSEEDLLGLRTQYDTPHSYLPTYRPSTSSLTSDSDYKKLVEKWKQSYLKAKYKDLTNHDFDSYASEPKAVHVPIPKPYAIEIPHPVIVPVPQPYPVKVPVPKPVAVPVIRELTVPVERPIPYPVVKKIPYPIEKPVPVPVEKEVQVPVMKPYPVPIPHIRPVFHHTRPKDEVDHGMDDEDDYLPRPEQAKKTTYVKRPRSTRNRRRPTRTYTEKNRRRWPTRRPETYHRRRPELPSPYRHYETEFEDFDHTHSDYILHCKRTGNC